MRVLPYTKNCSYRDAQGFSIINNALKYVSEWSGQNGLSLNPNKCVQCTFSPTGNADTDPDLNATINAHALSTVDTVTYLGVTFARNAKRTNHVEGIFRKCVSLYTKKRLLDGLMKGTQSTLSTWISPKHLTQ